MANLMIEDLTGNLSASSIVYEQITGSTQAIVIGKDFVAVNYGRNHSTNHSAYYEQSHVIGISGQTRSYLTTQGNLLPQLIYFQCKKRNLYLDIGAIISLEKYTSLLSELTLDEFVAGLKKRGMHFPGESDENTEDAPTSP